MPIILLMIASSGDSELLVTSALWSITSPNEAAYLEDTAIITATGIALLLDSLTGP